MGMKDTKDLAIELEKLCREDTASNLIEAKYLLLQKNIEIALKELA